MRGLGEMHLKADLEEDVEPVQARARHQAARPIPFRETIAAKAEGHSRHKKQTGGAGQFGEVFLKVEPLPRGTGFEFVDSVKGGAIRTSSSRRWRKACAVCSNPATSPATRCRTCA
jgi:elongation factor G